MDTAIIEEEDVENIITEEEGDGDDDKINPLDGFTGEEVRNPVKAIREKCRECSCGSKLEMRNCVIKSCVLYPFRMGKNPFRTPIHRVMTEEHIRALHEGRRKAKELEKSQEIPAKKLRV